MKVSIFTAII